ncbi:MAG: flippase-like domain-containing protein [Candidatus Caenarcaniphilales bacterium]|jgi:uncharacterized membrane protein YbhN (UPF0104 family)|nr:flippase-like domain-containing protein [Candidatus Caenarcaniphilales bacterium]
MKKVFSFVIKAVISIALIYLLVKFTKLDLVKAFSLLKEADIRWFIASIAMYVICMFTNTYRWQILANQLDFKLEYLRALRLYFESTFSNNFLPTNFGGDAIRAFDLGRNHSHSWLKAASTVIMERAFGFAMMFSLIPLGLIYSKFTPLAHVLPENLERGLYITFGAMVIGLASYKLWSQIPLAFVQKIKFTIKEYTKCKKSLVNVALWTFLTHISFVIGNICAGEALGAGLQQVPLWFWLILSPVSTLAGFFIPAVKGVGAKEACYVYMLGLVGVAPDLSLAIAFLTYISTLISTLPGVTIAFRKLKTEKIIAEEEQHEEEELEELQKK